jgi:hypothetical protein
MTKSNLRRKCFITAWNAQVTVQHRRKSRQELKAETCRQEVKQRPCNDVAYWLAFHGLLLLLSYTCQDHLPKVERAPLQAGPSHINHYLRRWPSHGGLFLTKIPSSAYVQVCVNLTTHQGTPGYWQTRFLSSILITNNVSGTHTCVHVYLQNGHNGFFFSFS